MSFVVPDSCTLPAVDQPLRLGEFDELFATAVRRVDTLTPTHARMTLAGEAGLTAATRDLTARETACCAFFAFTVTPVPAEAGEAGEALTLDIEVPAPYSGVLASFVQRASAVSTARTS